GTAHIAVSTSANLPEKPGSGEPDVHIVVDQSAYAGEDPDSGFWSARARRAGCAHVWMNLAGGQDEAVFAGGSLIVDAAGRLLAQAQRFDTDFLVADLDGPPTQVAQSPDVSQTVYRAATVGLRDYVTKGGFD